MKSDVKELVDLIKENAPINCSSINIFINYEEFRVEYIVKNGKQLKANGISMKNISGYWII